jgi:hypothetical protein
MIAKMQLMDIMGVSMAMKAGHREAVLAKFPDLDAFCANRYLNSTVAYTLLRNKRPVACGGIVPNGEIGVQTVWFVATDEVKHCGIELTKTARKMVKAFLSNGTDIRRIEGQCFASDKQAGKWATASGLRFEGMLEGAGPKGETMMLYAKARGVQ